MPPDAASGEGGPGSLEVFAALVQRFVAALFAGDDTGARACLAPAFFHGGRTADAFIAQESATLAANRARLAAGWRIADLHAAGPLTEFAVVTSDGRTLYRDRLGQSPGGRLIGDGCPVASASSLTFFRGRPTLRSVALRQYGTSFEEFLAEEADPGELWSPPSEVGAPGLLQFRIADDDLLSRPTIVIGRRWTATGGVEEASDEPIPVWLRGSDHPAFRPDLFPSLEGAQVRVPETAAEAVALTLILADGARHRIEAPSPGLHAAPGPVRRAVLTDALEHDWIVDAAL